MTAQEEMNRHTSAFPTASGNNGMTLRDWFAATMPYDKNNDIPYQSLQQLEIIAGRKAPIVSDPWETREAWRFDLEAAVRYAKADAMLRRREM